LLGIKYLSAGIPSERGELEFGRGDPFLIGRVRRIDACLLLLSGGGSALSELPLDSRLTLEDVQQFYRTLVTCGAPIAAINAVRKHFSAVKAAGLPRRRGARRKLLSQ